MIDQDNPENNTHTSWIHRLCDNNYFQSFSNHPTKLELQTNTPTPRTDIQELIAMNKKNADLYLSPQQFGQNPSKAHKLLLNQKSLFIYLENHLNQQSERLNRGNLQLAKIKRTNRELKIQSTKLKRKIDKALNKQIKKPQVNFSFNSPSGDQDSSIEFILDNISKNNSIDIRHTKHSLGNSCHFDYRQSNDYTKFAEKSGLPTRNEHINTVRHTQKDQQEMNLNNKMHSQLKSPKQYNRFENTNQLIPSKNSNQINLEGSLHKSQFSKIQLISEEEASRYSIDSMEDYSPGRNKASIAKHKKVKQSIQTSRQRTVTQISQIIADSSEVLKKGDECLVGNQDRQFLEGNDQSILSDPSNKSFSPKRKVQAIFKNRQSFTTNNYLTQQVICDHIKRELGDTLSDLDWKQIITHYKLKINQLLGNIEETKQRSGLLKVVKMKQARRPQKLHCKSLKTDHGV